MDNLHDLQLAQRRLDARIRDAARDASDVLIEAETAEEIALRRYVSECDEIDRRRIEEDDRHVSTIGDLMTERDQAWQRFCTVRDDSRRRRGNVAANLAMPVGEVHQLCASAGE